MNNNMLSIPWRGLAALYLMVEVVKFLVSSLMPSSVLTAAENNALLETYRLVTMVDGNGRPMIFTPARMIEKQEEQLGVLKQIELNLAAVIRGVEKMNCSRGNN